MQYPNWFLNMFKREVDHLTEDITIASELPPIDEVNAFKRNKVWKYIADTVDYRIKSARDDLENQGVDLEVIRIYQGRIEELRFIASLPDFIIENFKQLNAEIEAKKEAEKLEVEKKQEATSWERT